jgi:hypothetical protein
MSHLNEPPAFESFRLSDDEKMSVAVHVLRACTPRPATHRSPRRLTFEIDSKMVNCWVFRINKEDHTMGGLLVTCAGVRAAESRLIWRLYTAV